MQSKDLRTNKKRIVSVCIPCKSLKVKCDKRRPACSRCQRLRKDCCYSYNSPSSSSSGDFPNNEASAIRGNTDFLPNAVQSVSSISTPFFPILSPPSVNTHGNSDQSSNGLDSTLESSNQINLTNINDDINSNTKLNHSTMLELPNISLDLWNPANMVVSCGNTTHLDYPFALHSLLQYDPYTRLFCGALHGTILFDLQSRINIIANSFSRTESSLHNESNNKILEKNSIVGPLPFIEKAIHKWVEKSNEFGQNQLPFDFLSVTYTVEDNMDPHLVSAIQMIVKEIEILLFNKEEVDYYLNYFYENIYPFYPFLDIEYFEKQLSLIFINKDDDNNSINDHYLLEISGKNIRPKLQTLVLFLLILSISLRGTTTVEIKRSRLLSNTDASDIARQFTVLAQRILSLLNGFKFLNENILCCTLYLFLAEYLNPENRMLHASHDEALTLGFINEIAITLGFYLDPSFFPRYKNNPQFDERIYYFKRKLWIGVQSLRLQICTLDGRTTETDLKYLELFFGKKPNTLPTFRDRFRDSSRFDLKLFGIQEDFYNFHILMNKMMTSMTLGGELQNLSTIMENIACFSEYMENKFSINNLSEIDNSDEDIYVECNWRNAKFNFNSIRNLTIINANIIGLSALLSINLSLFVYFERLCMRDWDKYYKYYRISLLDCCQKYGQLLNIIVSYLGGGYSTFILEEHKYSINKQIIFTMVKLWRTQMNFSLRLCYKADLRKKQKIDHTTNKERFDSIIEACMNKFKAQMKLTADMGASSLQNSYFGAYQAIQMARYFVYLLENRSLSTFSNKYWEKVFYGDEIPERIIEKVNTKWGLGPRDTDIMNLYLKNPEVLKNLNCEIINELLNNLNTNNVPADDNHPEDRDFSSGMSSESSNLNHLLETNLQMFMGIIDDSMGELPAL